MAGLPAATLFALCSLKATSSTVPRIGAARMPHVSARPWIFFGLPFFTIPAVPVVA